MPSIFSCILEALGLKPHPVDVEEILDRLNRERIAAGGDSLEWRSSIVDLLKLLDIDSSHDHRVDLAKELGYHGPVTDDAAMNEWLHCEVMRLVALNGGTVPSELSHG